MFDLTGFSMSVGPGTFLLPADSNQATETWYETGEEVNTTMTFTSDPPFTLG